MAWNLVQRHLAEKLDIKVEKDDMETEARNIARMQFAQYGMANVPDETLAGFATSILGNKEEAQRIYEHVREGKILAALKPLVKISEKSVSVEEFQKIASEASGVAAQA
jgi:trigger factor